MIKLTVDQANFEINDHSFASFCQGELLTTAQWIPRFVDIHPDYKKDSVVNETICYDLINTFDRIALGDVEAPELLGKPTSKESNYRLRKYQETKREITKIVQ